MKVLSLITTGTIVLATTVRCTYPSLADPGSSAQPPEPLFASAGIEGRAARATVTDSASGGANSAYAAADGFDIPLETTSSPQFACDVGGGSPPSRVLSVTIKKGKAMSVLAIEGILHAYEGPETGIAGFGLVKLNGPVVNGFLPNAATAQRALLQDCGVIANPQVQGQSTECVVTGTWWLDIDAMEAAHPRIFKNKPLQVDLCGCFRFLSTTTGTVKGFSSLTARLEKK